MLKQVRDADLHLLRVFVAVAESGGIAAAQHSLNVAPSTISTQLLNLETRLGFRLCERGRAGFALTDEGKVVLDSAYRLFRDLGGFIHTMEDLKGHLAGTLKIVVLDSVVQNPAMSLDKAIALVRGQQRFLQFEVSQLPPGELENAIIRREADLGVAWMSAAKPSLAAIRLFTERQIACCGRGHPLFERAPDDVSLDELDSSDWVRRGYRLPGDFPYSIPPISTACAYHMESVAHFVLAGTHIGYLPEHYAERWLAEDRMRPILPARLAHELPFQLLLRKDRKDDKLLAPMTEALIQTHGVQS